MSTPRRSGFTLIELILVMLIACVVAAAAAPSLRGFLAGRKSINAAEQVLTLARYARGQAVSTGQVYRLNVDTNTGEYWLTARQATTFYDLGNEFGRRFTLPEGMVAKWQAASTAEERIDFYPDGRAEAAVLQLTDPSGKLYEIGCASETEQVALLRRVK